MSQPPPPGKALNLTFNTFLCMKLVLTLFLAAATPLAARAQTSPAPRPNSRLLALAQPSASIQTPAPAPTVSQAARPAPASYHLSGQVFGPNGRPLPGATLLLQGTQTAVSTDAAGKYSLDVPARPALVLVAGYAGYEEQRLALAPNQPVLDVRLRPALAAGNLRRSLQIGDLAPDFALPTTTGSTFQLSEHRGHPVVLYFYPKDGSSGCTKEACSFRDQYQDFRDLGAEVIGISSDDAASHQQFTQKYALPFPLLADQGGKLRKQYAVPRAVLGLLPGRVTYVLDGEGRVRYVFNSLTEANDHVINAKQILQDIR